MIRTREECQLQESTRCSNKAKQIYINANRENVFTVHQASSSSTSCAEETDAETGRESKYCKSSNCHREESTSWAPSAASRFPTCNDEEEDDESDEEEEDEDGTKDGRAPAEDARRSTARNTACTAALPRLVSATLCACKRPSPSFSSKKTASSSSIEQDEEDDEEDDEDLLSVLAADEESSRASFSCARTALSSSCNFSFDNCKLLSVSLTPAMFVM